VTRNIKSTLMLLAGLLTIGLLVSACVAPASSGDTQTSSGIGWEYIVFFVLIIAAFYFLMIRPQRNRQNQQKKLLSELKAGDQVITIAGMYGEIESLDDESIVLKVESGAKIKVTRSSVAGKRPETG
jgi:preprotein translocase subunit YajC